MTMKNMMKHCYRERQTVMSQDTPRKFAFIPIGPTVVVQCKDGGPWTHGTIVGKCSHSNRSYTIHITKTGQLITRNSTLVKPT